MNESDAGSDVREKSLAGMTRLKGDRFVAHNRSNSSSYDCWCVSDRLLQIDVFHWYGASGHDKAHAVAGALNKLGHTD